MPYPTRKEVPVSNWPLLDSSLGVGVPISVQGWSIPATSPKSLGPPLHLRARLLLLPKFHQRLGSFCPQRHTVHNSPSLACRNLVCLLVTRLTLVQQLLPPALLEKSNFCLEIVPRRGRKSIILGKSMNNFLWSFAPQTHCDEKTKISSNAVRIANLNAPFMMCGTFLIKQALNVKHSFRSTLLMDANASLCDHVPEAAGRSLGQQSLSCRLRLVQWRELMCADSVREHMSDCRANRTTSA